MCTSMIKKHPLAERLKLYDPAGGLKKKEVKDNRVYFSKLTIESTEEIHDYSTISEFFDFFYC